MKGLISTLAVQRLAGQLRAWFFQIRTLTRPWMIDDEGDAMKWGEA